MSILKASPGLGQPPDAMNSSLSTFTLADLATALTDALNTAPEWSGTLSIRGTISRGKLMLLASHKDPVSVSAAAVFAELETLIRQRFEVIGLPEEVADVATREGALSIQIYLKRQAQSRPWAAHNFTWHLTDGFQAVFGGKALDAVPSEVFEPDFTATRDEIRQVDSEMMTAAGLADSEGERIGSVQSEDLAEDFAEDLADEALAADDRVPDHMRLDALTSQEGGTDDPEASPPEVASLEDADILEQPAQRRWPLIQPRAAAAGVLAGILGGGLIYGVTRPCTLGSCDRITRAQALGDAALVALSNHPSPQTVLEMHQQLKGASNQLRPIPVWSFHHAKAQTILATYQQEVSDLDRVIAAQKTASQAAQASQSPPHPIEKWQTVATQWQTAVDQLTEIDAKSPIHSQIVAPKLAEYRANLATIEGRITAEQAAESSANQALQSALLATKQTEIANTLKAWETALNSWETAVSQLKRIPSGTLAYGEVQKLLPEYEAKLSQVRSRTRQERIADQFYTEAVRHASAAREFETKDQWTLALLNWRDAISQAQGIPAGTIHAAESKTLLNTYQPALNQAQENLRLVTRFQKAEADFLKACGPNGKFCTYGMKGGKVRMTLKRGYDSLVELSMMPPDQRTTPNVSNELIIQTNRLLGEITNLGKRTQLPIELYDEGGAFIARYNPELDGYVKH